MTSPSDEESTGWVAPGQPAQPGHSPQPEAPSFQPPPLPPPPARPPKTNGLAIASLVMGLFGCALLIGMILGVVALVQIRRSGDRGRGLAIGGIAASLVWVVILALGIAAGIVSEPDDGSSSDSGSAFQLYPKTGQCFDFATGTPSVDTRIVSCDRPHDGEMILVFELPKGPWPGETEVSRVGSEGCATRLDARFKTNAPSENVTSWVFYPRKIAWKLGDRKVHCSLTGETGTKLKTPIGAGDLRTRQWSQLKDGDCFLKPKQKPTYAVTLSDCDKPHHGQVTHRFNLAKGKYPGDDDVNKQADDRCSDIDVFRKHPSPVPIEQWYVTPVQETWALGDRLVVCYVTAQKGDLERSVLPR